MDITNEVQIIRYSKGKQSCLMDVVTQEYFLDIFVNGEKYSSLNCTPRELTELVIGHLICEGVITDKRDLTSLDINEQKGTADSAVKEKSPKPDESDPKKVYHTSFLFENLENFYSTSELFYSTGAVHKSALY
ncbi:MAG: sufurtransferase FdhD, partial [Eubacteriaceae bacterium]|nr:sufurtransferase FdhD [Eubacteriaceae bacterium]